MAVVVIRYEAKATARRALTFIVRIFVNDTIAITVWASSYFHVATRAGGSGHGLPCQKCPAVPVRDGGGISESIPAEHGYRVPIRILSFAESQCVAISSGMLPGQMEGEMRSALVLQETGLVPSGQRR